MTKTDFLEGLQDGLRGEVAPQLIQESIEYYDRYIRESMTEGKTEEQVLEELGPVRLIVKSIIDANTGAGRREEPQYQQDSGSTGRERQEKPGFHTDINDKGEFDVKYGKFSFNSWYGKLLLILLAVLVAAVVIALIIGIVMIAWYLLPVIVLLVIIVILVKIFMGKQT